MEGLLRTLTRSRNAASSPTRGSGGRSRNKNNDGHNRQFELILEMLARGLVEYAVRKYMPGQGDNHRSSNSGGRHDDRLRTRDHVDDDDQRHRGGVPNVDVEMLEHLGRNILSKAMERFGVNSSGDDTEREEAKASSHERGRRKERGYSLDRYTYSRDRSRDRSRRRKGEHKDDDHGRRRRHRSRDGEPSHRSGSQHRRGGSPSRRDEERRRRGRHRTDYSPLVTELEALSNAIISLNERQPGHADCEFYDAFVERSGKVQDAIGGVLGQIREREEKREEMREERRGRRRG